MIRCNCAEVGPHACCYHDDAFELFCEPLRCPYPNPDRPTNVVRLDGRAFQYQSDTGRLTGNCMAACIASILNVSLNRVPVLEPLPSVEEDETDFSWYLAYNRWLRQFGLEMMSFPYWADGWAPQGYTILLCHPGQSLHAIVAKDGEPIWNPMPGYGQRIGDVEPLTHWTVFQALDPIQ